MPVEFSNATHTTPAAVGMSELKRRDALAQVVDERWSTDPEGSGRS